MVTIDDSIEVFILVLVILGVLVLLLFLWPFSLFKEMNRNSKALNIAVLICLVLAIVSDISNLYLSFMLRGSGINWDNCTSLE